ncbi:MAG: metal-transporting ATPase [Phycisphaeraceae bacterium]|nr:MAG: metal-transporting ATPase [Phycisphaeraceae bacterium]
MPSPEPDHTAGPIRSLWAHKDVAIAVLALAAIAAHLVIRYALDGSEASYRLPLWIALIGGGGPLVLELAAKAIRREFGSDLLAGISIVTSILLDEHLAGVLVVLMLSGGEALEGYAVQRASGVLRALAKRVPSVAHVRRNGRMADVTIDEVVVGDRVVIHPHEIVPVDGTVVEGHAVMDESFLTGEPYMMSKAPGSAVISGAINGQSAVTIEATALAKDSRYAKIMAVMQDSAQRRPKMRRLADSLGAWYTPLAVALALGAWGVSGDPVRFLAVLVVATPCPLLIAIPTAIIGSISLAAKRGIIVKDPATLETIDTCRTIIFDKTGTLTYGTPTLTEILPAEGIDPDRALALVAALEHYSKHPLAGAIVRRAQRETLPTYEPREIAEPRGQGLRGVVDGVEVLVTDRRRTLEAQPDAQLPPTAEGLECVVVLDGRYAATLRFRDEPRAGSRAFIEHLTRKHKFDRVMLVSGDRKSEAEYLAEKVGIPIVFAEQTPEQKVEIVRAESERARTCFVGDGINDAPALMLSTVGIAFGRASDITTEAAGVVVLDTTLERVDEFFHISRRLRRVALQSAVGGMILSIVGMLIAAAGYLPPVAGAISQELIDVFAVANALRVAIRPKSLTDIEE